ncbi:T9SS type A sorting domain-containing protein [Chryseobacterium sp. PMSZPI]|uniref:T9SS type A sorting domain-containing protein n=1 Tax=Chryseobacterium sp. PMSZPI TaxID=1033900 RepID=UPI000C32873C|nr:T9SS type A sorting domain-containing protein [Chryseobacterium sp. PMSZPI]PKF74241.1 hypothetical protein CW752_09950 [Chryseobacterium sp. PMSZPI]
MKKLFMITAVFYSIIMLKSQWNANLNVNLLVADPGALGSSFSAAMNDGKTYIAYWKSVPAPKNYELWLQILDQNGNKSLGSNGLLISNQIPMSSYTFLQGTAVDSSNNFYIAVTGTANNNGYLFKITPQGTSVWPNGILLGEATAPKVLPLSNGDIIVSYVNQDHTRVQRFNQNGQAVWPAPIQILSDDPTKGSQPADIFELANNEIEIIFNKSGSGIYGSLFAQKLSGNGTIIWSSPKKISTKSTSLVSINSGVVDGNNLYYGFTASDGFSIYAYLQKINSDGSLAWGPDGVSFTTDPNNYQVDIKIASTAGSPHIWSIAKYTNPSQNMSGEYIQKFDKNNGTRLLSDNAKQVFPIDNEFRTHEGNLYLINDNPFFIIQKSIDIYKASLNAVLLNTTGNFVWSQQYLPMATYPAMKTSISSLAPINGQNVIVFQEQKSSDTNEKIYAQNLTLPNLGTNEVTKNQQFYLYPNPAKDVIYIKGVRDKKYEIYNTVGQQVESGKPKDGKIGVQNLSKGVYILKIAEQRINHTFIKE